MAIRARYSLIDGTSTFFEVSFLSRLVMSFGARFGGAMTLSNCFGGPMTLLKVFGGASGTEPSSKLFRLVLVTA